MKKVDLSMRMSLLTCSLQVFEFKNHVWSSDQLSEQKKSQTTFKSSSSKLDRGNSIFLRVIPRCNNNNINFSKEYFSPDNLNINHLEYAVSVKIWIHDFSALLHSYIVKTFIVVINMKVLLFWIIFWYISFKNNEA